MNNLLRVGNILRSYRLLCVPDFRLRERTGHRVSIWCFKIYHFGSIDYEILSDNFIHPTCGADKDGQLLLLPPMVYSFLNKPPVCLLLYKYKNRRWSS